MKMLRGIFCTLVIACFAASPVIAAMAEYGAENEPNQKEYAQTFSDVPQNHWAFRYIAELAERKAISGYPDGRFYPDRIVTRQEFAKIMVVAAGLTPTPVQRASYADVPITHWASPFVEAAYSYMTAYRNAATGEVNFKPAAGALREDIAVAVVKLRGYDNRLADLSLLDTMFSDVAAISAAARPYVALAVENEIISGYSDGTFRSQNTITRSEAAAILWRAFQYGSDEKVVGGDTSGEAVTPKPTPKPGPKSGKPFLADSLVEATITDVDLLMTMDSDSNLIYYDEEKNEILKLNPDTGNVKRLLNTATAAITVSSSENTPGASTTYLDFEVWQIFWDGVGKRLLVDGQFNSVRSSGADDGWEDTGDSLQTYPAIFTVENGELVFFAETPAPYRDNYSYYSILCALNNGTFVLRYYNTPVNYCVVYDFKKEAVIDIIHYSYNDDSDHSYVPQTFVQSGSYIYRVYNGLLRYDYGTGDWSKISEMPSFWSGIQYQNGAFYTWSSTELRATRPSGQKKTIFNPSVDVEIMDSMRLPERLENLFVTRDESCLFYDNARKVIRVIYPNPDT